MRDPLFQIILFMSIVLFSVLITLAVGKIREYLKERELKNFLKDFEYLEIENMKLDDSSIEALFLLAKAYDKEGDYEKALKIYVWINKTLKSTEILKEIAKIYFKAGFLEKAVNIAYQVLKIRPRDKEMLKILLIIDEKLGNFKEMIDIIEIFEELGIDLKREKANALIKYIQCGKSCNIEFCEGIKTLEDVYNKYPFIKREYIDFLFKTNPKKAYALIDKDYHKYIDLFFYRTDIPKKIKDEKWKIYNNTPFEIQALNYLPSDLATLEFEYICTNCKKVFPIYNSRCPHCNELFTEELLLKLSENKEMRNFEL
jgi:tetratricopeptide (TPR) repeat protein